MAWFNRLSVGAKILAAFMSLLVLMSLMGFAAVTKMSSLNANVVELNVNWIPARAEANALLTAASDHRVQTYKLFVVLTSEDRAACKKALTDMAAKMNGSYDVLVKLCASPEEKEVLNKLNVAMNNYYDETHRLEKLIEDGKRDEAQQVLTGSLFVAREALSKIVEEEVELNVKGCTNETEAALAAYHSGRNITIGVTIVTMCLGLAMAIWIARWITCAITNVDEISTAVAAASQQLAAAAEQLSSGAQQSASSLEETASSLEEMTATVKQNADNADQANQLANTSRGTAEQGGEVVASAVTAMAEINQASKKIADIITTIDEIAFQTNLLALNAAVEAARAGEQGRGFAVVAGEVRNLAQRSATAAREIKGLIQDSVQKVETGSALVNRSGDTLSAIVASVKKVTDIVAEIAAASREQSAGIEQINKAVAQMDQVTQSNASQTEEMSGTAVALSGQAENLQAVVAQFNINKSAEQRPTAASRAISSEVARPAKNGKQVRKSKPKAAKPVERELELVGAGAGEFSGFEEF